MAFASDGGGVVAARALSGGASDGPEWTVPAAWRIDGLVRSRRRTYAWLTDDDRCWLWDVGAALPVG